MPFVRVDSPDAHDAAALQRLSDAIQSAMVETIGIPADDRFHVFQLGSTRIYDRAYAGVSRTDRTLFIEITLRAGRTPEQKQRLYAEIAARAGAVVGAAPGDVFVVLRENGAGDWSFGDGVMQYAHLLEPAAR
jgi:phenylpyruvate tautomerase PptA (4-oxalocrotonate tautomerase family)